jgi:TonB family protein
MMTKEHPNLSTDQPFKAPNVELPEHEQDHSEIMDFAFEHVKEGNFLKLSFCIALYVVLAMVWMPGLTFGDKVYSLAGSESFQPVKRKVLRPPPEQPLKRVVTTEKRAKRVPMPDLTPDEPEPLVAPEPPPQPDVLFTDDWEIGIPDGPPAGYGTGDGERIVHVSQIGVEPPVITKRISPFYPETALRLRLQGFVILEAVLRKDGRVTDIKVQRGLGGGKFGFEDEAAKALKKWEFLPGRVNSQPVSVRMSLKIDFMLQ